MYLLAQVPAFDKMSASFIDYEQRARLRNLSAEADPAKRATMLFLRMDTIAQEICLNSGGDTCMKEEDAGRILKALRNYC